MRTSSLPHVPGFLFHLTEGRPDRRVDSGYSARKTLYRPASTVPADPKLSYKVAIIFGAICGRFSRSRR
jgi:hypothetical protein